MGLSIALNNALSGMKTGQNALDLLSGNVANAGTPGYNRRVLNTIEGVGANSTFSRQGEVVRAFNQSLQQQYGKATSEAGFASINAAFLDRVQGLFGKPGGKSSLDTMFSSFQTALSTLATSPDNLAARAEVVQKAQVLAGTLNAMSSEVQALRQETESRLAANAGGINSGLKALEELNAKLGNASYSGSARATLLDQRDRLVASLTEQMDLKVSYRGDDTVSLMTRSGVGLLDGKAAQLSFESVGALSASSRVELDGGNTVGRLILTTAAGLKLDVAQQNVLRSGEMAGLLQLRDTTLVAVQDQLDEIAAGLAQALSTRVAAGDAVTAGPAAGFEVDLASLRNGNELVLNYARNGVQQTVRGVRVDDPAKLPLDYLDANGARVIGLDFSGGAAAVAVQLQDRLGSGLAVTGSGSTLRVMDDGTAGTTEVLGLQTRATVSGTQSGLELSLFVDAGNADFTNALDGRGQKLGFAARIAVNSAVLADPRLLVQFQPGGSLGDTSRIDHLVESLDKMRFSSGPAAPGQLAGLRLGGTVGDLINQTMNYQGNAAALAIGASESQQFTLEALSQRMEAEYGVDVDEEMARLMELQNAYAANARVVAVAKELIDELLRI